MRLRYISQRYMLYQYVNSLQPGYAIQHQRSWAKVVEVMAYQVMPLTGHQVITWTSVELVSIQPLETSFIENLKQYLTFFSCERAALRTLLSVFLSVRPSHLFHNVPVIVSSWNFQELLPLTDAMQKGHGHRSKVKVTQAKKSTILAQIGRFRTNSSLNSPIATKWRTKL